MNKIHITGYFKNDQFDSDIIYDTYGTLNDNQINFTNNLENLQILLNDSNIVFEKEDDNSKLVYNFIENKITNNIYTVKNLDQTLELILKIKTTKILINDNNIIIDFEMLVDSDNKINYELNIHYEVI